jgi:hypothetical protein
VTPPTPERNEIKERANEMEDGRQESDGKSMPLPKNDGAEEYPLQGTMLGKEPPMEGSDENARDNEKEAGYESEEEEPEGTGPESPQAPNLASSLPARSKVTVEDAPEEESHFQDIAL